MPWRATTAENFGDELDVKRLDKVPTLTDQFENQTAHHPLDSSTLSPTPSPICRREVQKAAGEHDLGA
jgi:hypothetical protein